MKETRKISAAVFAAMLSMCVSASWYWPFGSDDEKRPPRLSELMEPATALIDEASDLAGEGKISEAAGKYREALEELSRIERENPERAKSAEFSTLRIKRAYVNAAIDSMLMRQARENAKTVAVSDTTELERKLAEEKAGRSGEAKANSAGGVQEAKPAVKRRPKRALTAAEEILQLIGSKEYGKAEEAIGRMLRENPNNAAALNLRAVKEAAEGKYDQAERTLDRAIQSNPRDYHAYYNMAMLYLQTKADGKDGARRYYETGRALGGPEDGELEKGTGK